MDVAQTLRLARSRSGLGRRELARRAGTSPATLAAYEAGRKDPGTETLRRILRAAGFDLHLGLGVAVGGPDPEARGRELAEVLALAEQFPARHRPMLDGPVFGRPTGSARR